MVEMLVSKFKSNLRKNRFNIHKYTQLDINMNDNKKKSNLVWLVSIESLVWPSVH